MHGAPIKFPAHVQWLTVICIVLAALTTTWSGIRTLPAGQIADAFLALAFGLVLLQAIFGGLKFSIPFWIWLAPVAVILCMAVRWFDPVPYWDLVLRMNPKLPYQAQPYDFIKGAAWLVALIVVPIAVIGCTKIYPKVPELIMGAFALGVCISSGVALTDLVGWTNIGTIPLNHGDSRRVVTLDGSAGGRQVGLTSHPNMLGLTVVMAIPLAMYFLYVIKGKWKLIPAVGLVLLFGGAFATGSRGAQAGALILCALAVACAPQWRTGLRQAVTVIGSAGIAVVVLGELFMSEKLNKILGELFRFGGGSYDVTEGDQTREFLVKQAVHDLANYPIAGVGMKHVINAHNIYLELIQAGGFILFIGVMLYWIFMYRDGWLLAKLGYVPARYLMVSVAGWLILGMVSNQLTDRQLYYAVGCIAGMAALYLGRNRVPDSEDPTADSLTFPWPLRTARTEPVVSNRRGS